MNPLLFPNSSFIPLHAFPMTFTNIGIIGAGAMGTGIAQVAATAGCKVKIIDTQAAQLEKSKNSLQTILQKLQDKGKIANAQAVLDNLSFHTDMQALQDSDLVIEAIVENLEIKKSVFQNLEKIVKPTCILASNTSSLSITSIAASCTQADRVIGIHFFNPAPLMPLVEIIPAIQTRADLSVLIQQLMLAWKKSPVIVKDTPGFIVNRIARPFYGEAIRIMEENIATKEEIDLAMTQVGGFKMGPFELTDYIGHDVNYIVTETVFQSFFYDVRYKPSLSQKRLLEANWLGRKTGKGFYDYAQGEPVKQSKLSIAAQTKIVHRILAMLINEAVDALYLQIASDQDIETAMTKGVNYPKGLLAWCDALGADYILSILDTLFDTYREERYRASALLRQIANSNQKFLS